MQDAGYNQAGQVPAEPEITPRQIIEATMAEVKGLYMRLDLLEQRLRRYDRIFETIFREEAERRLLGKQEVSECCGTTQSPLAAMEWRMRKGM